MRERLFNCFCAGCAHDTFLPVAAARAATRFDVLPTPYCACTPCMHLHTVTHYIHMQIRQLLTCCCCQGRHKASFADTGAAFQKHRLLQLQCSQHPQGIAGRCGGLESKRGPLGAGGGPLLYEKGRDAPHVACCILEPCTYQEGYCGAANTVAQSRNSVSSWV